MMINVLEYLEQSAAEDADRIAVCDGHKEFTRAQLLELSRRVGSGLLKTVERRRPVIVFMEKTADTLTAFFGIVYAGAFYTLIDPLLPASRQQQIEESLHAKVVLTDDAHLSQAKETFPECRVLEIAALQAHAVAVDDLRAVRERHLDTDPLYVNFTSGSTGVPKGVLICHRSVIDFINVFVRQFGIRPDDVIANQAPLDFDVSVKDLYSAMLTGAKLVLVPRPLFTTPAPLLDFLCEQHTTVMIWAVSALCIVSGLKGLRYRVPEKVRIIMFSGEVMPIKHLQIWQAALPQTEYVNLYGPSEITCNCTYYRINRTFEKTDKLPIGGAFPGRTVFLMDEEGKVVTEPGVSGEICCAGESLAICYYNNPEQTAKQFIMYDLNGEKQRVYKTGDLAAYGTDGELYFAGRGDFQIKHMGHRIELEEIETNFMALDGVARAVCLFDEPKNRIVCWYMGDIDPKEVRIRLKEKVPAYMVPGRINRVDDMPYNKNGKIDRAYFRGLLAAK